jgi:hypothetical protein
MWSHFILALSLFATFIECRPEQNNKKLKVAIKENYVEDYDNGLHFSYEESGEKKVI